MEKKMLVIVGLSILLTAQSFFSVECAEAEDKHKYGKQVAEKLKTNDTGFLDKWLHVADENNLADDKLDTQKILPKYRYLPENPDVLLKHKEAEIYLYIGLNANTIDERKAFLTKGIALISEVCTADKDAIGSMFLASKLYRAYGGLGYAKMYYDKSIAACTSALLENMECRQAYLDLAILNISGDSRFYKDYHVYTQRAELYAEEVLKQVKTLKNPDGRAYYQAAMANFVLKKNKDANQYLRKAIEYGYITDESYRSVCENIIEGKYNIYPVKSDLSQIEFISYSFGRLANN